MVSLRFTAGSRRSISEGFNNSSNVAGGKGAQ